MSAQILLDTSLASLAPPRSFSTSACHDSRGKDLTGTADHQEGWCWARQSLGGLGLVGGGLDSTLSLAWSFGIGQVREEQILEQNPCPSYWMKSFSEVLVGRADVKLIAVREDRQTNPEMKYAITLAYSLLLFGVFCPFCLPWCLWLRNRYEPIN